MVSAVAVIRAICYCVFIIFGVSGNCLVCLSIRKRKKLRTLPNYLVFNLAVADLLFCVTVFPFLLITAIAEEWILGYTLCQLTGFLTTHFCVVSISTLVLISINRYFAVGRPRQYSTIFTAKRVFISIGIIWCVAFLVAIPPILGWSRIVPGDNFCTIDGRKDITYAGFVILVGYLLPLISLVALYTRIFLILRGHAREMVKLKRHGTPGRDYDDYSSSDMGSLRRRHNSGLQANQIATQTEKVRSSDGQLNRPANGHTKTNNNKPDEPPVNAQPEHHGACRRSLSADELARYAENDMLEENRRRSSSLHLAQPLSSSNAVSSENVDVQGLMIYRNKLYVNNVSVVDDTTSVAHRSTTSLSREPVADNAGEFGRGSTPRTSKLSSLAYVLRRKVKPNLRKISKEAKLTRMLFTVVTVFFICWTPVVVGTILYAFEITSEHFDQLSFGIIMASLNSVCNPFIYAFMNTQFRQAFREIAKDGISCRR